MTLISLAGITIAVFALVATLAVRAGFRTEFVATILGANAHVSVYSGFRLIDEDRVTTAFPDYEEMVDRLRNVEGVARATPIIRAQLLASSDIRNAGIELFGIGAEDLASFPLIAEPEVKFGDLEDFESGIAVGSELARLLGVEVGDPIRIVSPDGVKTAFGVSPRVNVYDVVYIFGVGRYDIDRVRAYLPFGEAQAFLDREGRADEIEIFVDDPEQVEDIESNLELAAGDGFLAWSWKDSSGAFLRALEMEDSIMFIILSILVLIAASNIVSGLVMLVKNKGRDIGILRTVGLSQGSILRVFFICGASIGLAGTLFGVILGCLFAIYIDPIFQFVNYIAGGGVWDPQVRFLSRLPARLEVADVLSAVALSLGLSFGITIFPARRAARINPFEALRYE